MRPVGEGVSAEEEEVIPCEAFNDKSFLMANWMWSPVTKSLEVFLLLDQTRLLLGHELPSLFEYASGLICNESPQECAIVARGCPVLRVGHKDLKRRVAATRTLAPI